MDNFKRYSGYYDLLNSDKDYSAEVDYITGLIQQHTSNAKTILNFGCGTGEHDYMFIEKGYSVAGIDISAEMIAIANSKLDIGTFKNRLSFEQADIRSLKLGRKFDAVVSLFHVMSYQVTNEDIKRSFLSAFRHLEDDGVFIFDCWYGPGVLTDRPHSRNKSFEDDFYLIERKSTPVMHPNENCVDVNFEIKVFYKQTNVESTITEVHTLRYLFFPEVQLLLQLVGFEIVHAETWLSKVPLSYSAWNAVFICKKIRGK